MVICAGIYSAFNTLIIYNSETKTKEKVTVEKLNNNDIDSVTKFFECFKNRDTIDFLCIGMEERFKNEFRKKIIEKAKDFGVKNVRLISEEILDLFEAIYVLLFVPKHGDILWIFDMADEYMRMNAWIFDKIKKWKYHEFYFIKKIDKCENHDSTIEDLKRIKESLKTSYGDQPYIFCNGFNFIEENDFMQIFPYFTKLMLSRTSNGNYAALSYARFLSGEKDFIKYETEVLFNSCIIVDLNNEEICTIKSHEILPFSTMVTTDVKQNDIITIKEAGDDTVTFSMSIKENGKFVMDLYFNLNGIYTLHYAEVPQITTKNNDFENETTKNYFDIPLKITNYNPTLNAIGIDLGTTECCAAVIRKNGPDFVVLDPVTSLRTMPSYIAFDENQPKCGQIVVDRLRHHAKYSIFDIKRIIGKPFTEITTDSLWPFKILPPPKSNQILIEHETVNGTDKKSPEKITAVLVTHIKKTIEAYQNKKICEVVLSIPAEFSETQKIATRKAAEYTGFDKIHFIPEPVAAAFAYFSEIDVPNQSIILICDCGGGTVDICVAKVANKLLSILCTNGDSYLGGRDFDKILFNHFSAILKHKFGIDVLISNKKYILKQKCQDIKHKLSAADEEWLDVSDFDPNSEDIIKLTREEFEAMATDILLKIKNVILQTIIKAKIEKSNINYVFQVGGGCRMPMIKKLLADVFPKASHQCNLYPDWVVAHGAALYAYYLKQNVFKNNQIAGSSAFSDPKVDSDTIVKQKNSTTDNKATSVKHDQNDDDEKNNFNFSKMRSVFENLKTERKK